MTGKREAKARAAANRYARMPEGTAITYGLICVVLLGLALWLIARFYDLDLLLHPISLGASAVGAFVGVAVLHRWRKRQHNIAYKQEYDQGDARRP